MIFPVQSDLENEIRKGEALFEYGEFETAERLFFELLSKNPANSRLFNNIGVIHHAKKEFCEAEKCFLKTLEIDKNDLDALMNLADLYQTLKLWDKALMILEKCVYLDPGNNRLKNRLEMLNSKISEHKNLVHPIESPESGAGQEDTLLSTTVDGHVANEDSSPFQRRNRTGKITMKKEELIEVIKRICYVPHPDVNRGQLFLSKEIFDDEDRETNVVISSGARIDITGNVKIGPWTMIGDGTRILTHDHFHRGKNKPLLKVQEEKGVHWQNKNIGMDVWLHGCTVLHQVTEIPDGVVVGNGSVLTKNPRPYEIWAGNPAKKIGER
jgi:acetyltransferase-like isoleucine patch superfamily enzyme